MSIRSGFLRLMRTRWGAPSKIDLVWELKCSRLPDPAELTRLADRSLPHLDEKLIVIGIHAAPQD